MAEKSLGNASVVLSVDNKGLVTGIDNAQQKILSLKAGPSIVPRIDMAAITAGVSAIQSQLKSINFSQFLTGSIGKGALDLKQLNWGEMGAGLGAMIGGPLGATLGAVLGSSISDAFERKKEDRELINRMRSFASSTGVNANELAALNRLGEQYGIDLTERQLTHLGNARLAAQTGNREMQESFRQLGVRPESIRSLGDLTNAFSRLDGVQRRLLGQRLFGDRGGQQIGMLLGQAASDRGLQDHLNRLGTANPDARRAREIAIQNIRNRSSGIDQMFPDWMHALRADMYGTAAPEQARVRANMNALQIRNPQQEAIAGAQAQLPEIGTAVRGNIRQLAEEIQLGRQMTEVERQLFQLQDANRNNPAVLAAINNQVAAINNQVQAERQLRDIQQTNQQFRSQGDILNERLGFLRSAATVNGSAVNYNPAAAGRALFSQLEQAESALGIGNLSKNAGAILENSREAIIASQSRTRLRFQDNIQERIANIMSEDVEVNRRHLEAFNEFRRNVGTF